MPHAHPRQHISLSSWILGCAALFACTAINANDAVNPQDIKISIIIDDMGSQHEAGINALQLPGSITYAFLPHTPHSKSQARTAHKLGKEVMLHLPMQAMSSNKLLGPGSLTLNMERKQFGEIFRADLASIPHASGVNNHMGSLLTRHPGHMHWLMEEIKQQQNLYFIDSRTTHHSVANLLAHEFEIPSRQRDVFLDDDPSPKAIALQFKRLIKQAKKRGSAIGIGHPYKSTLRMLKQLLPSIRHENIKLVPVSQLVLLQPEDENLPDKDQTSPIAIKHSIRHISTNIP